MGLIHTGEPAEQVLREGSADLIAIGRGALQDPFWPLHTAQAMGLDEDFEMWSEAGGPSGAPAVCAG